MLFAVNPAGVYTEKCKNQIDERGRSFYFPPLNKPFRELDGSNNHSNYDEQDDKKQSQIMCAHTFFAATTSFSFLFIVFRTSVLHPALAPHATFLEPFPRVADAQSKAADDDYEYEPSHARIVPRTAPGAPRFKALKGLVQKGLPLLDVSLARKHFE